LTALNIGGICSISPENVASASRTARSSGHAPS